MNLLNLMPYISYCVIRECPDAYWEIPTRTIYDHELVLIECGSGIITVDGTKYHARPSQLFYFYPGLPHSLLSNPKDPLKFHAIHFSFCEVIFEGGKWSILDGSPQKLPIHSVTNISKFKLLLDRFQNVIAYWKNGDMNNSAVNGNFLELLYIIKEEAQNPGLDFHNKMLVKKIIQYINQNINQDLKITDLASIAGLSQDYLGSIFKKHTGYTINKYINKVRIDRAKELLFKEHTKVREVADSLGFRDEFYFSRVFKKFEGVSPSEFMRVQIGFIKQNSHRPKDMVEYNRLNQ